MPTYAVVTPVRNEAENIGRLAGSLAAQTLLPSPWVIVDNGSEDGTVEAVRELEREHDRISLVEIPAPERAARGGPIVRAFAAGVETLAAEPPEVVVKLDADVSMDTDFFARLVAAFARDERLGIAGGTCYERADGRWLETHGTRSHVWGACRAYRWACLEEVAPLEERQGWDEIDSIRAQARGWRVRAFGDLPFRHHRPEGERDGAGRRWRDQGDTAHYMGYRPGYLLLRTAYQALREPAALAMLSGYADATVRRQPRCPDPAVLAYIRREQGLSRLPLRIREALGRS
jgi:glycosyltransferase involved in cell wall biosynthesis